MFGHYLRGESERLCRRNTTKPENQYPVTRYRKTELTSLSDGSAQPEAPVGVVVLKSGEQDIEHCYPGETTADVTLPAPHLRIEVEVFEAFKAVLDPPREGVAGTHDGVIFKVQQNQPFDQGGRDTESPPGQPNQPFSNGVEGFSDIPAGAVECPLFFKGRLQCVDDL